MDCKYSYYFCNSQEFFGIFCNSMKDYENREERLIIYVFWLISGNRKITLQEEMSQLQNKMF